MPITLLKVVVFPSKRDMSSLARRIDAGSSPIATSADSVHEHLFSIHHRCCLTGVFADKHKNALSEIEALGVIPLTGIIAGKRAELHVDLKRRGTPMGMKDIHIAATAMKY